MNGHLSRENSDRLQTMLNERFRLLGRQDWVGFLKTNGMLARSPNLGDLKHWGEAKDGFVTMANPDGHRWLRVPMDFAVKALTLKTLPEGAAK